MNNFNIDILVAVIFVFAAFVEIMAMDYSAACYCVAGFLGYMRLAINE